MEPKSIKIIKNIPENENIKITTKKNQISYTLWNMWDCVEYLQMIHPHLYTGWDINGKLMIHGGIK